MPEITEKDLREQLKSGSFERVYLFFGEEKYLTEFYTSRIVSKSVTAFEDFNLHSFSGQIKTDALANAVSTAPMMSDFSCTVLSDCNFAAMTDSELEKLKSVIAGVPDTSILIFRFVQVDINPSKSARVRAVLDCVKKHGSVLEFKYRTEGELASLLCRRAGTRKCQMHTTTAHRLIDCCGIEMSVLYSELDKLCDYVGEGGAVSADDIAAVCVRSPASTQYELSAAVCRGDAKKAYIICDELFAERVDPSVIISELSSAYIDIYRMKLAEAEGVSAERIASDFGYGRFAFRLKYAARNSKRMSVYSVRRALTELRSANLALKTLSPEQHRTVIEKTLSKLMQVQQG